MKRCKNLLLLTSVLLATTPTFAQDAAKKDEKPGDAQMMAMMMEMAKPGENHKILADTAGTWKYTVKWWVSPDAPPMESTGTCKTKAVMDGRYVLSDHAGKMSMPGVKTKVRQVVKYMDQDHHTIEFFEDRAGTEIKTMELAYTRASAPAFPIGYFEVAGPDASKLADFYRGVFGWEIKPGPFPGYFDIAAADGSSPRGGIRQEEKSERVLYVRVPDLQAVLDKAVKNGAKVVIPPTVVKGVVTFALFEDPAGNRTGLIL